MSAAQLTAAGEPQTFHVFETRSEAKAFRQLFGGNDNNIIVESLGWRAGDMLPPNATACLWPSTYGKKLDPEIAKLGPETSAKWIADIAASTKATLRRAGILPGFRSLGEFLRTYADAEDIDKAIAEAVAVENTNAKTDRDYLIELAEKASAMSEADYQAEMHEGEARFESGAMKYDDAEQIAERLSGLPRWIKVRAFELRAKNAGQEYIQNVIDRETNHTDKADEGLALDVLARIPLADYEHLRECGARLAGVREQKIDKIVDQRRKLRELQDSPPAAAPAQNAKEHDGLQGSAVFCPDTVPWPQPVNGAEVLSGISERIASYIAFPKGAAEADAAALWCAITHCYKLFRYSPRLNIISPEKQCGKSTMRSVVGLFVRRPLSMENLTTATAFRLVEKFEPTLLADEIDTWLPDNDELRGFFNAGYEKGAAFARCEGDNNEVRLYNAFAPVVLCGIGALRGKLSTLHDRSLVIKLERAKPGELKERFDSLRVDKEKELARKLARFCADNLARLATIDPQLPDGVFNRLADNWRPLFAIAEVVGGDWPKRCTEAFSALTSRDNTDIETLKVMLLADIRQVFAEKKLESHDWISTGDLIDELTGPDMKERPWSEVNRGKEINDRWLATRLGDFGIKPGKLPREGKDQKRGYNIAAFFNAFDRYLNPPVTSGQVSQQPALRGEEGETDTKITSVSTSVSAVYEGKRPSETDVHLKSGNHTGMTPGEFLADTTKLFNAKPQPANE